MALWHKFFLNNKVCLLSHTGCVLAKPLPQFLDHAISSGQPTWLATTIEHFLDKCRSSTMLIDSLSSGGGDFLCKWLTRRVEVQTEVPAPCDEKRGEKKWKEYRVQAYLFLSDTLNSRGRTIGIWLHSILYHANMKWDWTAIDWGEDYLCCQINIYLIWNQVTWILSCWAAQKI